LAAEQAAVQKVHKKRARVSKLVPAHACHYPKGTEMAEAEDFSKLSIDDKLAHKVCFLHIKYSFLFNSFIFRYGRLE